LSARLFQTAVEIGIHDLFYITVSLIVPGDIGINAVAVDPHQVPRMSLKRAILRIPTVTFNCPGVNTDLIQQVLIGTGVASTDSRAINNGRISALLKLIVIVIFSNCLVDRGIRISRTYNNVGTGQKIRIYKTVFAVGCKIGIWKHMPKK